MDLDGFWMDVGQPKDYLSGISLYLNSVKSSRCEPNSMNIIGNVIIDPSAKVHKSAVLGPDVVVGENCVVGEGVRLQKTCLFKGVKVGGHSWVDNSIIGWNSTVGQWVFIVYYFFIYLGQN